MEVAAPCRIKRNKFQQVASSEALQKRSQYLAGLGKRSSTTFDYFLHSEMFLLLKNFGRTQPYDALRPDFLSDVRQLLSEAVL